MVRSCILVAVLLGTFLVAAASGLAAASLAVAVTADGTMNEQSRGAWLEVLAFRLRWTAAGRPTGGATIRTLSAKNRVQAIATTRKNRYDKVVVWNPQVGTAEIIRPGTGRTQTVQTGTQGATLAAVELLARTIQVTTPAVPAIDIVHVCETSARMYRLKNDAGERIVSTGLMLQNALPAVSLRSGLLAVSGDDAYRMLDLGASVEQPARILRDSQPAHFSPSIDPGPLLEKLATEFSWREGALRIAVFYMNAPLARMPAAISRLEEQGIRIIAVPADGAGTATCDVLSRMARLTGGAYVIPDYLVRYSDASRRERSFLLEQRTLLRMKHAIRESNWHLYYRGISEPPGGSRRFRAGSIGEALEIIGRGGRRGLSIGAVQSRIDHQIVSAISRLAAARGWNIVCSQPDTLLEFRHGNRRLTIPFQRSQLYRATPQAESWLGFTAIPDPYAEDRFRVHPGSLLVLPSATPPPGLLRTSWRELVQKAGSFADDTLFSPGRRFIRIEKIRMIPIQRRTFNLEE